MADFVYDSALGRVNELHNRVDSNDPANSVIVLVLLKASASDSSQRVMDDLTEILAGTADEATFTNYARKTITDSGLSLSTVDTTNHRREADLADQTWTSAGGASNDTLTDALVCYDSDSTSGTDANIEPLVQLDFSITTNGGDLTIQFNTAGYFRAAG